MFCVLMHSLWKGAFVDIDIVPGSQRALTSEKGVLISCLVVSLIYNKDDMHTAFETNGKHYIPGF